MASILWGIPILGELLATDSKILKLWKLMKEFVIECIRTPKDDHQVKTRLFNVSRLGKDIVELFKEFGNTMAFN